MFEKLQFWKKDEPSFDSNPFENAANEHPFGADTTNPFTSAQGQQGQDVPNFDQQGSNDPFSTPQASMDYTQQQVNPFEQQQQPSSGPQTLGGAEFSQAQVYQSNSHPQQQMGGDINKRDIELILSRLDLIKSELDNVQHKLSLIENQNQKPKW